MKKIEPNVNYIVFTLLLSLQCAQNGLAGSTKKDPPVPEHYACLSDNHEGFRFGKDSTGDYFLVSNYGVQVVQLNSKTVDGKAVTEQIRTSDLPDKALIVRILDMYADPNERLQEIFRLACTYKTVANIIAGQGYAYLQSTHTAKEIKRISARPKKEERRQKF